ncbi:uncharacterized protein LOC127751228 [Frankliniella occidentalis]|uniref:Uncharacterized protein LOC127751228 n=1 Tax=Frankliniella occidentalis TaxID=133901 RepID=A0A9C6XTF3_FRAOC|nr:uncharacterized protein LOC127751228 [Frankliniella occidentalis]
MWYNSIISWNSSESNALPWSVNNACGAPNMENTCVIRACAISSAVCLNNGTITGQPENASTATNMYSCPSLLLGLIGQHISTCHLPCNIPSWNNLSGALVILCGPLNLAHTLHSDITPYISLNIPGHQKNLLRMFKLSV